MTGTTGDVMRRDIARNPGDLLLRKVYADWLEDDGQTELADFVRIWADAEPEREWYVCWYNGHWCRTKVTPEGMGMRPLGWAYEGPEADWMTVGLPRDESWEFCIRNGFVSRVWCPHDQWIRHGPKLVRQHPVTWVKLTDRWPLSNGRDGDQQVWAWAEEPWSNVPESSVHRKVWDLLCGFQHHDFAPGSWKAYTTRREANNDLAAVLPRWAWKVKVKE